MKTILHKKTTSMIPEPFQPLADRLGLTATGVAAFLNIKLGFLGASFSGFIFSPIFNSILTIIISMLSILWIAMKIYDQFLVTKKRKQEVKNGKA